MIDLDNLASQSKEKMVGWVAFGLPYLIKFGRVSIMLVYGTSAIAEVANALRSTNDVDDH